MIFSKPILFLDFDRTLFDLSRLMGEYFGFAHKDHYPKMRAMITAPTIPDLSPFLYPDTMPFLEEMQETHHLILVSRAQSFPEYQRRKVVGSGITSALDHIYYSVDDETKGVVIKDVLSDAKQSLRERSRFIDDNIAPLLAVKRMNPEIGVYIIDRRGILKSPPYPLDGVLHKLQDLPKIR